MAESNATPMAVAEAMSEATPMAVAVAEAVAEAMSEATPMAVSEAVATPSAYFEREKNVSKKLAEMLAARQAARAKWAAHQLATQEAQEAQQRATQEAQEAQQRAEVERNIIEIQHRFSVEARVLSMIERLNDGRTIRNSALMEEQAGILIDIVRHGGTVVQLNNALNAFRFYRGNPITPLIESGYIYYSRPMPESVMSVAMDNNRHDILEFLYSEILIRPTELYNLARRRGRLEEFRYLFSQKQPMSYGDYQAF